MYIFDLQLTNCRNYVQAPRSSSEKGLNLFVGETPMERDNLLEAVYLLSTLRSSRASSDSDLVQRDILAKATSRSPAFRPK
ncbi:hypothetical protein [Candidatus Amarobacter glycogenicus]|uniref:hypothetical protein n=1 Tax=Candidatus Amarobacter glycogenicus TaxID=3140699 RepID=UPI003136BDA5|nr:hypothetical protein [Dehalococcoidia bacterium]